MPGICGSHAIAMGVAMVAGSMLVRPFAPPRAMAASPAAIHNRNRNAYAGPMRLVRPAKPRLTRPTRGSRGTHARAEHAVKRERPRPEHNDPSEQRHRVGRQLRVRGHLQDKHLQQQRYSGKAREQPGSQQHRANRLYENANARGGEAGEQ